MKSQNILTTLALKDPRTNAQEQRNSLYNLVQYVEKHPEERHELVKGGAIKLLERLRDGSEDNFVIENARLGLALLGLYRFLHGFSPKNPVFFQASFMNSI